MTMALNGLRRSYDAFGGQLRLWFMPYATVYWRIVLERLTSNEPQEQWHYSKSAYVMAVGMIVDCEALVDEGTMIPDAAGLLHFFTHRSGDVVADYDLFIKTVSLESMTELQQGYDATRIKLPKAAPELQQNRPDDENDPEPSRAGGKRGRNKSPR